MLRFRYILILAFLVIIWSASFGSLPEQLDIYPSIFMDFEYHGGDIEGYNHAFYSKAPGIWSGNAYIGDENLGKPAIADDAGIDGHDCLDKTGNSNWGGTFGPIRHGSSAVGYDSPLEAPIDNLWSVTICGWFKAEVGKDIGGDARIFYRGGQIEVYTPGGADAGGVALLIPANSGANTQDVVCKTGAGVYSDPGEWVFFAVTYDGTLGADNVKFYKGSQASGVELVGVGSVAAGQLTGGEHMDMFIGSSGSPAAGLSTAGYLDKFTVFSENSNSDKGVLSLEQVENVRRWHLGLERIYSDVLCGDADIDGDVDGNDIAIVNASILAGGGVYFWSDGDFDGDMDVDADDLSAANANFTGAGNGGGVEVAVLSNMVKIKSAADVNIVPAPSVALYGARGEHEGFQVAVLANQWRVNNVSVSASDFVFGDCVIPASAVSIRRADKIRISGDNEEAFFDPLMEENTGNARAGDVLLFWVDFDIPRDAFAGLYAGNIIVTMPDGGTVEVPVSCRVWNFNIPIEQSLQTSFNLFRQSLRNFYGGDWNDPTDSEYRKWLGFVTDYRLSPIDMSLYSEEDSANRFVKATRKADRSWEFDFSIFDQYLDYIIGRGACNFNMGDLNWHFYKPFWGYDEGSGIYRLFNNLYPSHYEQAFSAYLTQASDHYASDGDRPWVDRAFFYAYDELNTNQSEVLQQLIDRYDIIGGLWPELRRLTTAEPARYPSYEDHLDIWTGKIPNYETYTADHVDRLRGKGNEIWLYVTGYHPPYCNLEVNEPGIEHRMIFWQTALYRSEGFLHWGLNVWPYYRIPNPWSPSMAFEAEYDRWPNRDWDDAGWVIKDYTKGGGYLIYPGPDGPVASLRLEQVRDGLEDYEYLNLLAAQSAVNNSADLIARAEAQGVAPAIINAAISAMDISSVVQSMTDYTHDVSVLGAKRIELGNAIEALVNALGSQKEADLNDDDVWDMLDIERIAARWLSSGPAIAEDLNADGIVNFTDLALFIDHWLNYEEPIVIPDAEVFIPFENSDATAGNGSEQNPGWQNVGSTGPEDVSYIGSTTASTYPVIVTGGIKGGCMDITSFGSARVDAMQTLSYKGGVVTGAMSGARSYTFTFWVNTRDAGQAGSETYVLHQFGVGTPAIKWRSDGRLQANIDGTWYYSDYDFGSNNRWVFVALTVKSDGVNFYVGSETLPVASAGSATGLSVGQLPVLSASEPFILNGYTYNASDKYAGYDMDEFRIYSSSGDDSGALDLETLENIRLFDLQ
jgi:hypothetical protein